MTILLDPAIAPERGRFEIHTTINIQVTALEAKQQVDRWLLEAVSTMIGARLPNLVISQRPVWRVPVWIGFPRAGQYELGFVDVDVETGIFEATAERKAKFQQCASEIAKKLPPYQSRHSTSPHSVATLPQFAQITRLNLLS